MLNAASLPMSRACEGIGGSAGSVKVVKVWNGTGEQPEQGSGQLKRMPQAQGQGIHSHEE